MRKVRDLCRRPPPGTTGARQLDNVVTKIFPDDRNYTRTFYDSEQEIEPRYGIDIDPDFTTPRKTLGQLALGPNERYIANKITEGPHDMLLMVVGGIGVGKTHFRHRFIDHVSPSICNRIDKTTCKKRILEFDFQGAGEGFDETADESISALFREELANLLQANLEGLLSESDEITVAWEAIRTEHRPPTNAGMNHVFAELVAKNCVDSELTQARSGKRDELLQRRREIRRETLANTRYRLSYLQAIYRYLRHGYYQDHPNCLQLIVDNIDPRPAIVQCRVKLLLKEHVRATGMRVTMMARQTTYYQSIDDQLQQPVDTVPFCGASPVVIVRRRLHEFVDNPAMFGVPPSSKLARTVQESARTLLEQHMTHEAFDEVLCGLAGHSVRKALLLAQNLLLTRVYDVTVGPPLHVSDVLRALIIGDSESYTANLGGLVDNLFAVDGRIGKHYFVKPRILRCIKTRGAEGCRIGTLVDMATAFEYPMPLLREGLTELLAAPRRLVWADTDTRRLSDLHEHAHTRLHLSSAGEGYLQHLIGNIAYVQEVMMDTYVDPDAIGHEWNYWQIEQRLDLVYRFVNVLFAAEKEEAGRFLTNWDPALYVELMGSDELFSEHIARRLQSSVERILRKTPHPEMQTFREELVKDYDNIVKQAQGFSRSLAMNR